MLKLFACATALWLISAAPAAAQGKGIRFWNLTANTITSLNMSPAGKDTWGPDQCKNDKDGTVDHNERLRITGIEPGVYDVKFTDKRKRNCTVKNIEVKADAVFTIEEKQLKGSCGKK